MIYSLVTLPDGSGAVDVDLIVDVKYFPPGATAEAGLFVAEGETATPVPANVARLSFTLTGQVDEENGEKYVAYEGERATRLYEEIQQTRERKRKKE